MVTTVVVVLGGWVVVVVVVGAAAVVVVVVVAGDWVVVVVAAAGGGVVVAGTTVTVGLLFGPVTVTVCDVGGGAGAFDGVLSVRPTVTASKMATNTAATAPATVRTRAVRLYHGSRVSAA